MCVKEKQQLNDQLQNKTRSVVALLFTEGFLSQPVVFKKLQFTQVTDLHCLQCSLGQMPWPEKHCGITLAVSLQ